jgi:hypothetical protein
LYDRVERELNRHSRAQCNGPRRARRLLATAQVERVDRLFNGVRNASTSRSTRFRPL